MALRQRSSGYRAIREPRGERPGRPEGWFPETPPTPCDGDFLASAQTVSQSAVPEASVLCVRHGSQAVDVDHGQ